MEFWIVLIAASSLFWAIGKFWAYLQQRLATKEEDIRRAWEEIAVEKSNVEIAREETEEDRKAIIFLAEEKSQGFPWLARAYADYFHLRNIDIAKQMETKSHPARISAEKVREVAKKRRIIEEKLRIAQGTIEYYHDLFPFLEEFTGDIDDEILKKVLSRNIEEPVRDVGEIGIDPVRIYLRLPDEEYQKLSTIERNQRALDAYWQRSKSKWQIGRDYERYVGYIHEINGYSVYYQGILEGFDDLGRDLICKNDEETIIVQCKRWSEHKTIHEKHVNQLFGTAVKYSIECPNENVKALLCTSTKLSDRANLFAEHLNVAVAENYAFRSYPSIKCNISRRTGEKIYHLPFDQQYDKTIVEEERNECYVETVAEAEELGFRRAWRWKGPREE